MLDTVIVNSSEICLKGGNRRLFEDQLLDNIRTALADKAGGFRVVRQQASFHLVWPEALDGGRQGIVRERLSRVFGIANFSLAHRCPADTEKIGGLAVEILEKNDLNKPYPPVGGRSEGEPSATVFRPPVGRSEPEGGGLTFRVEARRNDKSFPLKSPEIAREIGGMILERRPDLKVRMKDPDIVLEVRIVPGGAGSGSGGPRAFVSLNPSAGPGGLPVGSSGRLVSLLSGGIDSPVAAWKMMRRGCRNVFVHCHSYPYVGQESVDKVKRLAEILNRWQGKSRLYLLPFADIQREIVARCHEANRVVLYRRMMLRLAEAVAEKEGALGLVTGDSVGQVASQTVENIRAVSAAVALPIYRPLCGDDKDEITAAAARIGTYGLSIEPHDDCCSLFTPDHPVTKSRIAQLDVDEARYDFAPMLQKAMDEAEVVESGG
ncbi:tRNA 4-thiouridine(8) synthase ThiI [Candidatus Uhrbacteria bacterium]|nr:tRNA 4-thiouridine(8) synthase ThiI [Candidatus Uhrbacteria bacterium]